MPQAGDEICELMRKWFGDFDHDSHCMLFLGARGYTFSRGGMINKPTPAHTVSFYERKCLQYLAEEWDYAYNFRTDNMDASS
jgi:hypothetical protein